MRAFLNDLNWSKQLLQNAEYLAAHAHEEAQGLPSELKSQESSISGEGSNPTGFNWEYPGALFIRIHVNCLGMIFAQGFWCEPQLPKFDAIEKPFRNILRALDPDGEKYPVGEGMSSTH